MIVRQLATEPAFAAVRPWVTSFTERMIEAQTATVRRWARRRPGG